MQLSVIVPTYNAGQLLAEQLEALSHERWEKPWELIIADNGSTDETRALVESYQARIPGLRFVEAAGRRGAAHARNVGVSVARGQTLAFVDADDVIAPGWVAVIGAAIEAHSFVASRFDIARLNPEWVVRSRPNTQGQSLQKLNYPPYLPHAGGSGMGVRRDIFMAVGGFDEEMRYLQDTDFCIRVQLAGTPLVFAADALVHMRYRDTPQNMFRQARRFARYNVRLARKYRPAPAGPRDMLRGWLNLARRWRRLLFGALALMRPDDRALWIRRFGWLLGLTEGGIAERIPPPQI
ncbi:glycosyltransferase [Chloroflexales bacterium ZM16-3]|nr:glycosyltransferase [Chloroflexales bacterium ZM16-3]